MTGKALTTRFINTTGERLCRAMDAANVSVNELARETGLSRSTIRNMRNGSLKGSLYSWKVVCGSLGVSVSEMIGEKVGKF